MGHRLKTRLYLVKPELVEHVVHRQSNVPERNHDRTAPARTFQVRGTIYAKNYNEGANWMPEEIVEVTGLVSFKCRLTDKRLVRTHQDQIRSRGPAGGEEQGAVTPNLESEGRLQDSSTKTQDGSLLETDRKHSGVHHGGLYKWNSWQRQWRTRHDCIGPRERSYHLIDLTYSKQLLGEGCRRYS